MFGISRQAKTSEMGIFPENTKNGIRVMTEICRGAEFRLSDILTYLPVSFLYIFAMILGYVGLRYVVLSVSTPICNSSGAVAALLCFFILKQEMM